ncbi:dipeptidyl peptidase IV N-terminal region-domain-containing protein [Fimicolochytrium jonesii]|uniref:dipeptidyl peptidase IV N-terminal region-domain-containing protein n=1 Tax=Fimicolochytrium jonesii TaxID=1396493 RepID=UPI0022FDE5E4|nr:dipeptidyl peptidase IV N-terminal region-domain-containing protein [Fimicolochytrium jonesii]KAI8824407.1 dipeptidyl peptidase IV N-terminal region-domain-containing protein [Fimicolochytrium jonesii]
MRYVLVETDYERGWRHSFLANYWLWDVNKKEATRLPTSEPTKKLALVMWSKSGNNIAWVRENNIYVTLNADPHIEVPITNDGSANIINGIADWVYEEEVFGSHEAMWFSPDGTHVAYLKFNETEVPEYNLQYYERNKQNSYPEGVSVKYPKPGYPNPVVTLHIATPGATNPAGWDNLVELDPLHYFPDNDRLFVEVTWVTDNSLLVRTTNRVQDTHRLFLVKAVTANDTTRWRGTLVRNQTTTDGGWITKLQPLTFIPPALAIGRNQPSYVELLEDADGYMHIAHFQSVNSVDPAWLTKGAWEVEKILAVDAQRGLIYYSSTEDGPTQRHIFSVALDGTKERLTPPKGELPESPVVPSNILAGREAGIALDASGADAGFYSARFSPGCGFYVLQYEGPGVPWSRIYKADLSEFRTDVDNKELWNVIGQYAVPQIQYFQIPIAHQSEKPGDTSSSSEARQSPQMMNAMLRGPHDFNANGTTKYPVLMRVYGGPNSQLVQQRFSVDFMTAVVSAGGFLSLTVDGRGTGLMGRKFRTAVASHLGSVEVDDQLAAADWLRTQSFVDPARIAIWGWSYGGYMTAKCIEANSGRFALGMSVAPVTDWMYYDSIYTERYMKTPRSNPKGYEGSAVTEMEGFRNAKYLLVHGTADDNVHFQNTASLIWKLTNARIRNYQVQVYTDSDHSMSAGGAPREVYVRLWNFLMENLQGEQYRLAR